MKTINDYAELVKEKHALNKTIAPVETDLTDASRGYHIGEQFIIDGELNKAKTEIAQHDALVLNTNYEPADNLTEQIKNAGGGTGTDPRLDVFENNIASVETDETDASKEYKVGEQLILNNILYDVIAPISEHDVITTTGSGANIAPADPISSKVEALTKEITDAYALMSRNGAKNHVHVTATSQTINGVTFTVNDDGSIKANGTATEFTAFDIETTATGLKAVSGNYLLSDGLANPSASHYTTITVVDKNDVTTYDYANTKDAGKQAFSIVAEDIKSIYLAVCIGANVTVNNLVFYPMVRDAEDIDNDFQPYAKTNQQLTAENQTLTNQANDMVNVLGAKNLLPNNAVSQTINGVTFTVNSDGSVTANGTATELTLLFCIQKFKPNNGNYILSGGVKNGAFVFVNENNGTTFVRNVVSIGNDTQFTLNYSDYDNLDCGVGIESGVTVNNETFYPMIRPASIQDDTYVPYSMTNKEMTPYVQAISNPNLLDNPWFTVNQRGFASTSSAVGYTVDRWRVAYNPASNTCELTSNGIVLNSVSQILIFQQRFDEEQFKSVVGKMTTFSVLLSDGTMHKGSAIFPQKGNASNIVVINNDDLHVYYQYNSNSGNLPSVGIYPKVGKTVTIKAVKLEIGEVSTLASDTAPNYATELLKCQRYFVRIGKDGEYVGMGMGQARSQTLCSVHIPSPVQMRAKPTLTISGNVVLRNGNNIAISTSGNVDSYPANEVILALTTTGLTEGSPYDVFTSNNNAYIDLSADL